MVRIIAPSQAVHAGMKRYLTYSPDNFFLKKHRQMYLDGGQRHIISLLIKYVRIIKKIKRVLKINKNSYVKFGMVK